MRPNNKQTKSKNRQTKETIHDGYFNNTCDEPSYWVDSTMKNI